MGKLERIMKIENHTEREDKLTKYANSLGCSISGHSITPKTGAVLLDEAVVVRRIREAERSRREHKLWWIALISAIASVISALAAWTAVLK